MIEDMGDESPIGGRMWKSSVGNIEGKKDTEGGEVLSKGPGPKGTYWTGPCCIPQTGCSTGSSGDGVRVLMNSVSQ